MINKNKLLLSGVIVFALLIAVKSNISAGTLILDYGSYHFGQAGEFNACSAALNPKAMGYASLATENVGHGLGFETFDLETKRFFHPGGSYNYTISDAAFHGGIRGGSDPISLGTAWLYLNFAKGTLTGYDYTNGLGDRNSDAGELQQTIWWLESEVSEPGGSNPFTNLVLA